MINLKKYSYEVKLHDYRADKIVYKYFKSIYQVFPFLTYAFNNDYFKASKQMYLLDELSYCNNFLDNCGTSSILITIL